MNTAGGFVRPMTEEDLALVLAWRNHPNIRRYMLTRHGITHDEHRHWFETASRDPSRRLLVFEDDSTPLGFVQFSGVRPGGVSDWGFYAAPDAPRGTGRNLGRAALRFGFGEAGLHKICGQALRFNEASIRFHRMLGFQQEGTLREQHFDGGLYHDLICFGLLRREWSPATSV